MVRASAVAEKAGVPSVSLVAVDFVRQARAIARAIGAENLAIAEYPGVIMTDAADELRRKVADVLLESVVRGLATAAEDAVKPVEPEPHDIVFKGTLRQVQQFFYKNLWTDGLPIIPPTVDEIQSFLTFTDRSPEEVIGILPPENRQATVWNVAVNGVMAGCLPEYMPILLSVAEAIADPEFRLEDAGSTPGWEPIIILNGPIIKDLDFNYGGGAMRLGRQANSSIGRFLRLYMRNAAGLRPAPGATDKGSISYTFNVVLAENEDAVAEIGWPPFSVDRGFRAGDNVVTVQSAMSISPPTYSAGVRAVNHLETVAELIGRRSMGYWSATCIKAGKFYPLFVLGPAVARMIARDGLSKDDVRQYLYDNVKLSARSMEWIAHQASKSNFSFCDCVEQGIIPKEYCESTDPERMLRIFLRPEMIGLVVSGDPGVNQSKGYMQNQKQGAPVSRRITLPEGWSRLLEARQGGGQQWL
ncbi:MAG: hypothetical protein HYX92_20765 [Chloroflexi bacterium]|nr:hypothetical protein [Chloroflexota bacterium]